MQKSKEFGKPIVNITEIHKDLQGNDGLLAMYAIRQCVMNNISDKMTIMLLQELKSSTLTEWGYTISGCAVAALHLIGAEKYTGNDRQINELISTHMFTGGQTE